ncbi:MAG: Ig-like domain-containing protein [Syntrophomonadaceae bacterium]|nr:Ig-like domain-containing protein [Eubacterium aggregans]MDD3269670.1 Ig-like domain-containing protein [Syntrophomonadaceae bacterium]
MISETAKTVAIGEDFNLITTVSPENAANKAVIWNSDKEEIAIVDATGKVTAIKAGIATITVTTADGNKTATCAVTVNEPVKSIGTTYQTHVQNVGWQGWKNEGEIAVRVGKPYV